MIYLTFRGIRSFRRLNLVPGAIRFNFLSKLSVRNEKHTWETAVKNWLKRYEDVFGITKLTEMHEKVLQVQAKVQEAQQKRRSVQKDFLTIQNNLQEIQTKLEKIPRDNDMFLTIVTQEHELLKEQKQLQNLLGVLDRIEREEQTALALAINMSQDHEQTYHERNKYLSLVAGLVGGLIGVIGSSVNNWWNRKNIKLFAEDITTLIRERDSIRSDQADSNNEEMFQSVTKIIKYLDKIFPPTNNLDIAIKSLEVQTDDLMTLVKSQEKALFKVVSDIDSFIMYKNSPDKDYENFYSELFSKTILEEVDCMIDKRIRARAYVTGVILSTAFLLTIICINMTNS